MTDYLGNSQALWFEYVDFHPIIAHYPPLSHRVYVSAMSENLFFNVFLFSKKKKKSWGEQYTFIIRLIAETLESNHHVLFHYKNVNICIFRSYVFYVDCCSASH